MGGPLRVIGGARGHVLPQPEAEEPEVLEHDGEDGHIFVVIVLPDIHAV